MRFGLLGEKLGHSYSPELHAFFGDYEYELFEVAPDQLGDFIRHGDFQGLNVTIPYKTTMLALCDDLTEAAAAIGSVNTVVRHPDGSLFGDNTDAAGFEGLVWKSRISIRGRKCLVLGSGGASLSVQYVLHKLGAGEIVVISRSGPDNYENLAKHADAEVIVNTTPVGMYPNTAAAPVDLRRFPRCQGVLDLIYNPARTALMQQAEALKIPNMGGLFMLAEQARCAASVFTGKAVPAIKAEEAWKTLGSRKENRILIGMPGCGKSTVASALGAALNREVVEADALIAEKAGMSIPEIFARSGEEGFRALETEVLAEQGKRSGIILSTGGGCVTRRENYPLLHQNGTIFCLTRDLSKLPTDGRPISQSTDLSQLYARRKPLYAQFADVTVSNDGALENTLNTIKEALS